MTHDPLCPYDPDEICANHGYPGCYCPECQCELIAKVRADEAAQWINGVELNSYRRALRDAAETILSLNIWNPSLPEDYGFNSGLAKAIKAVHRLLGEQQ